MEADLSENDRKVYWLLVEYLTEKKGCLNAILSMVYPPKVFKLGQLLGEIKMAANLPDIETTEQTINAVLAIGLGSSSLYEIGLMIQDKVQEVASKKSRINRNQVSVVNFALLVARAYWKVIREPNQNNLH